MVLDLLSFISLFFFTFFSAFCSFFFLLPTALLQGGKHAREMFYILQTACGQNCSTEGTLSANTFAKIQLSNLPFTFFLNKLNYIFHNCLWQTEMQPTDFIHASNSYLITRIQWLLCLRLNGFGVWGDCFDFLPLLLRYVGFFVVLFLSFCRLVYLTGNFPIENKWKCIPAPLFFSSSGIQAKNPTGESPGCCPQEEEQEAEPRCACVASKPPLTLNRESRWKEAGRAVLGSQPLNSLKESKQARQTAKGKGQNSLSTNLQGEPWRGNVCRTGK